MGLNYWTFLTNTFWAHPVILFLARSPTLAKPKRKVGFSMHRGDGVRNMRMIEVPFSRFFVNIDKLPVNELHEASFAGQDEESFKFFVVMEWVLDERIDVENTALQRRTPYSHATK